MEPLAASQADLSCSDHFPKLFVLIGNVCNCHNENFSRLPYSAPGERGPILRLGGERGWGLSGRVDQIRPSSLCMWEKRWRKPILLSPTSWGRYRLVALIPSGDLSVHAKDLFLRAKPADGSKAVGESGKDDYDKFSLPTGSGFIEDTLKAGTCRLITNAQFDRSGPKRFSCNEMKC